MKITKLAGVAAATSALVLAMSACANQAGQAPGGDTGGDSGGESIRIGIKFDQPGLGLQEGAEFTGFDVEVAQYVANELGYSDVEFVSAPSAQREDLIENGQVDMIFATYSITEARQERVSFAGPYFVAGQDLLVRADDTSITGPESLPGKRLCSVSGSTSAENVQEEYGTEIELQEFPDYATCVTQLAAGGVDAVTTDDVILAGFAAQPQYEGQLKVVGQPFSEERYGVGIKKGDTELCTRIDDAITSMIDSGAWQTALDETVGQSGFTPNPEFNPPTEFEPCV
ncbi:glutamate ABC transporter substrate-binding protein [Naumannella halotolerans]|uniref:Glutamate transport system substrate-binding protein n=1 Tax=Naumannella halotolerans TaxID=993414 RepID=A0A4R7J6Z8_9ACTN|nr:glutamate ABC transporter substrate-binding protein [Naumannella halotolerans]TDT33191.1 glutamate transport system substrate-binding protein [Naumannella halotolerans]